MKRNDEEFAKAIFNGFLINQYDIDNITWSEVEIDEEPPDYYLHIGELSFAVEVTTLSEYIRLSPNQTLPYLSLIKSLHSTVRRVEKQARNNNDLNGLYGVSFGEPFRNYSNIKSKIVNGLQNYLQSTQGVGKFPVKTIVESGSQYCSIEKVDKSPNKIEILGPTDVKFADGIKKEICNLLNNILARKSKKLDAICKPKILLILDQYNYPSEGLQNPDVLKYCKEQLSNLFKFHTVYIISKNKNGMFLSSKNYQWVKLSAI